MLKITAIALLFLNGFIIHFDGVVKCAPRPTTTSPQEASKKKRKSRDRIYDPNHGYEPYWPGGDWVLYGDPDKATTKAPPEICGDECHYLYEEVGEVCGRNIDNIKYKGCTSAWFSLTWYCYGTKQDDYSEGYQTFKTYCEFLDKQCKSAGKTKPPFQRWIFVHQGPCIKNHNATYYKPMYRPEDPVSRLNFYLQSVNDTFNSLGQTPC